MPSHSITSVTHTKDIWFDVFTKSKLVNVKQRAEGKTVGEEGDCFMNVFMNDQQG